jgi:hypothetical protein
VTIRVCDSISYKKKIRALHNVQKASADRFAREIGHETESSTCARNSDFIWNSEIIRRPTRSIHWMSTVTDKQPAEEMHDRLYNWNLFGYTTGIFTVQPKLFICTKLNSLLIKSELFIYTFYYTKFHEKSLKTNDRFSLSILTSETLDFWCNSSSSLRHPGLTCLGLSQVCPASWSSYCIWMQDLNPNFSHWECAKDNTAVPEIRERQI